MSSVQEVPPLSPDAGIDEIRQALGLLIEAMRVREPQAGGESLQKFITWQAAVNAGLANLTYNSGSGSGGGGGDGGYEPPPGPGDDDSPPDPITGLVVTGLPGYFFIEIDAPTYTQGGGNGYTEIYGANYSGTGPLPTVGDAVQLGQITGRGTILILDVEPGQTTHFWAGAVTVNGVHQKDAMGLSGGTNGVAATADQIEGTKHIKLLTVESAHIISLAAGKLTAGNIGVSEYIQSTGFVSGSAGWRIRGDGVAEFSDVMVRGTIYANYGQIGGAGIFSDHVESSTYDGAGNGWRLDNATGKITAGSFKASNVGATRVFDTDATGTNPVLKVGSAVLVKGNGDAELGSLEVKDNLRSGQTAYDTGTGWWLGTVSGTPKFSIGNASHAMVWTGAALQFRGVEFDGFSASIAGGAINWDWTDGAFPSRTVSLTGGRSPFKYQWLFIPTGYEPNYSGDTAKPAVIILEGSTTTTCTIGGQGINSLGDIAYGHLGCIVTDANGRVTYERVSVTMSFDGPPTGAIGGAE